MFGGLADIGSGIGQWRTWWTMGVQDIELRYRRSLLGPFWISASLICLILALAYVYSAIFKTEFQELLAHLATGQLAWGLIVIMVLEACGSVMEHGPHMSNVPMPLTFAAGRIVLRNAIIFLHNAVAVLTLLFLFGVQPQTLGYLAIFGVSAILFVGYCLVLILGPLCARFRDIRQVVESIMQAMFFVTPIFWRPEDASNRPGIVDANPFYHLIELVRAPLLGRYPTELNIVYTACVCATLGVMALITLSTTRKRVVLWI